jgi:hypothetical protein
VRVAPRRRIRIGAAGDDQGDVDGQQREAAWVERRHRPKEEGKGGGRGVDDYNSPLRCKNLMATNPMGIRAQ